MKQIIRRFICPTEIFKIQSGVSFSMPRKSQTQSTADKNPAPGGVAAVDRALCILSAFGEGDRSLSVTVIADRVGLHKSTVLRLLNSLSHARLLQKTAEGQWALGPEISRLATLYWSSFDLETVVKPHMRALVEKTRESVSFHVRQGDQRLVLFRIDSPQLLRDHTKQGDLVPLDRGAGGRVLLAFDGAKGTLYEQIRSQGFAMARSDRIAGVSGISAPVWSSTGRLAGALTLSFPETRFQPSFIEELLRTAEAITQALGGRPQQIPGT